MNHTASLTSDRTAPADAEPARPADDVVAAYDLGYRHCLLDLLGLPASERATLLRQASPTKEG